MATAAVTLPGGVAMAPSANLTEKLAVARVQGNEDLDPERFVDQLRRMSGSGVPLRLETGRDESTTFRLYTDTHVALLRPTSHDDGYLVTHVARWGFRDHRSLAQGFLRVHCPHWTLYSHVRHIGAGHQSFSGLLKNAWEAMSTATPAGSRPDRHLDYLDTVERIILRTRDLERERLAASPMLYRARRATREQRYSARGVYEFRLAEAYPIAEGAQVQVAEDKELRGMVLRSENLDVTVRFDGVPDFARIPAQGVLTVLPSDVVYKAQLGAVTALRNGEATSPRLLTTLAEQRTAPPPHPDRSAIPLRPLDGSQLDAYQRALGKPDLLLVLGPPGTGKTWTITEIAVAEAAAAARGGAGSLHRTLVTAQSNRAVDNVLAGLADHLRCVRVGNPEALTGPARELTAEAQVDELKDSLLRYTQPIAAALEPFSPAGDAGDAASAHLVLLRGYVEDSRQADAAVRSRDTELDGVHQRLRAPLEPRIAAARSAVEQAQVETEKMRDRRNRAQLRHARTAARRVPGWWAAIHNRVTTRRLRALRAADGQVDEAEQELAALRSAHDELLTEVTTLVARDSAGGRLLAERENAWGRRERALSQAARAAEPLRGGLELAGCGRGFPDTEAGDVAGWERREQGLLEAVGLARARASLLTEWRGRVPTADEELKHELVSYADVIAATCIGVSTKNILSGLSFDLAIVDEAGQIALPDLLVPLVRARRAVLVGDHHQLPPYLDSDVAQWAEGLAPSSVMPALAITETRDIVARSEFERLFERLGVDHGVTLTTQRRMPATVATFISQTFYGGVLTTDHPGTGPDLLFRSPLAFVDTSDRPPGERQESRAAGNGGISNRLEARLIADLVARYAGQHRDWAVIVPYRAQVRLLRRILVPRLGGPGNVEDNIGTVDAFQGNERDLIIYGFTRSNRSGSVGFLRELRRLNVAMSRTRRQLVMVGDLDTLARSTDAGFANVIANLRAALASAGDLRGSREIQARLRGTGEDPR